MRAIERILGTGPVVRSPFAVRAYGTTREEAAAAAAAAGGAAFTTGGSAEAARINAQSGALRQ